jgi:hypothetical protein
LGVALILAVVIGTAFHSAYYALDCLTVASALAISTFVFHLFLPFLSFVSRSAADAVCTAAPFSADAII